MKAKKKSSKRKPARATANEAAARTQGRTPPKAKTALVEYTVLCGACAKQDGAKPEKLVGHAELRKKQLCKKHGRLRPVLKSQLVHVDAA